MPSGYTSIIKDGTTLADFALHCARAFGALVHMRDEPMHAPITTDTPDGYHLRAAADEEKMLADIYLMSAEACDKKVAEEYAAAESAHKAQVAKDAELRATYEKMLKKVMAWAPPTEDHQGLKDFMVEQIKESIEWDCREYSDGILGNRQTGAQWQEEMIKRLQESIAHHRTEHQAEVDRCKKRNDWIQALRDSLK